MNVACITNVNVASLLILTLHVYRMWIPIQERHAVPTIQPTIVLRKEACPI